MSVKLKGVRGVGFKSFRFRGERRLSWVYFGLLFFSLGGLMLQGGVYLIIGATAWFSVVFGWFICYYYRNNSASLKADALNGKCALGCEVEKGLESS